jgi:hypothetical protein
MYKLYSWNWTNSPKFILLSFYNKFFYADYIGVSLGFFRL